MYEAIEQRNADYDGLFFYGVKSTGIFCRPSCPSKVPKRENVVFFKTAADAMQAGFRPCKRCRSDLLAYHPMEEIAKAVKDHLDALYSQQSSWNDKVRGMGISERRATDIFKEAYGLTPKAYMDRLRLREAERLLATTDSKVIDIAAAVGFGSLATFNRFFKEQTGGTPTMYRNGLRHPQNKTGSKQAENFPVP